MRATGTYSTLEYLEEAGDLGGIEIFVGYGGQSGHFALIQCSEGFPDKPVLVHAFIDGNRIELSAHQEEFNQCPRQKFIGVVTRAGLKGSFSGDKEQTFLPRKKSYWQ